MSENYSDLTKWRSTLSNRAFLCHIVALTCLIGGTECGNNSRVKTPIYAAPAVKGLMQYWLYMYLLGHVIVTDGQHRNGFGAKSDISLVIMLLHGFESVYFL